MLWQRKALYTFSKPNAILQGMAIIGEPLGLHPTAGTLLRVGGKTHVYLPLAGCHVVRDSLGQ